MTTELERNDTPDRSSAPFPKRSVREINVIGDRLVERYGSRVRRRREARFFRRHYNVVSPVVTHHIHAGDPPKTCSETSIKIPWVAVHGIDSICVVARRKDLRRLEKQGPYDHIIHNNTTRFLFDLWNTIISQVEDIAASLGESPQMFNETSETPYIVGKPGPCQMLHLCSKSPFGVVSVVKQDMDKKGHKVSSAKYDAEEAVKFLREKMESLSDFTFDTTTQAAIFAFQHLFRKKFKARQIRVFVLKNDEENGRELEQSREVYDIEEFLDIINGKP